MLCVKCKLDIPEGSLFCNHCGKKQASEPRRHARRPNGTGTVYRMPGRRANPWAASRDRIFLGSFPTKAEATKALERLTDTDINEKTNYTFAQVYAAWSPQHFRTIKKTAIDNMTAAYNRCTALQPMRFRNIRKSDFVNIIMQMERDGYSKSTVEKQLQLFSLMSKWAYDEDIIQKIRCTNITTTATQKSDQEPFTQDQLLMISISPDPAAIVLRILIACGCRPGELFNIQTANCYDTYFIGGGKTAAGTDRIIRVSPYGLPDYQAMLAAARAKDKPRLIDGYSGNKTENNYCKREYKDLARSINLGSRTPYSARHTWATTAMAAGIPHDIIARQLGHEDITTTDRFYNHPDQSLIIDNAVLDFFPKKKASRS